MSKYFVLDTNVLLHNPISITSFAKNVVIIPITVIEELDTFKAASDKNGMHAREVIREIDTLIRKGALKKGATLPNKGKLRIYLGPNKFELPNLSSSIKDNQIIAAALDLQNQGKNVIFVSKDVNARVKAEALGIPAEDYEYQKVEYSSLYKGWTDLRLKKSVIDTLYNKGSVAYKNADLLNNQYIRITCEETNNGSALARFSSDGNELRPVKSLMNCFGITPLNLEQQFAFDLLLDSSIQLVTLVGQAGTGKTLLALACGLQQVIGRTPCYEKILVARPIVPLGKDIGYLPGTKDKKLNYWMQPIFDNLDYILHGEKNEEEKFGFKRLPRNKTSDLLESETLEIEAITYIRGRSIPKQFMVIDEAQNLTPHEIKTIISRAGKGTKIVLTGDPEQIDNPYLDANSNGLSYTVERMKGQNIAGHVFLSKSERSGLASLAVDLL